MGTHPIFESDFDCLTEMGKRKRESTETKTKKRYKHDDISKLIQKKPKKKREPEFSTVWFDELMNESSGRIEPDGVEIMCAQLGLAPDSLEILIMCYSMDLSQMGFIERHEFLKMSQFIASRATLKNHLVEHRMGLRFEMELSKKLHRFAFDFCRDDEKKIIDKETAVAMLTCVMKNRWKLLDLFCEYLHKSTYRGINRDQWNNIDEFVRSYGDFENAAEYDPDGAWPVMIDEFVEFIKTRRNGMDC